MPDLLPISPDLNKKTRDCRPCSECCDALPLAAGYLDPQNKHPGEPCSKLAGGGCRIHSQRFELCRRFKCAWLADTSWDESWRPDLSGMLCLREWIDDRIPAAVVYELRPGVVTAPEGMAILAELCRTTVSVTIVAHDGARRRLEGKWKPEETQNLIPLGQARMKAVA